MYIIWIHRLGKVEGKLNLFSDATYSSISDTINNALILAQHSRNI